MLDIHMQINALLVPTPRPIWSGHRPETLHEQANRRLAQWHAEGMSALAVALAVA
jgi:hypothetical protein